MTINIQSPQFKTSEELEALVQKKVSKLFNQNPNIIRADVTLKSGESSNLEGQYCEINLVMPGGNLFAKKNADKYEKAVAETVEALSKIMRRQKDQAFPPRYAKATIEIEEDTEETQP